jgi:hypothetical protein
VEYCRRSPHFRLQFLLKTANLVILPDLSCALLRNVAWKKMMIAAMVYFVSSETVTQQFQIVLEKE